MLFAAASEREVVESQHSNSLAQHPGSILSVVNSQESSSAIAEETDSGALSIGDEDCELVKLLQHVQGSDIPPLTPLSPLAWQHPLRDSMFASTSWSRYESVRRSIAHYGPSLIAGLSRLQDLVTTPVSFKILDRMVPLKVCVSQGISSVMLSDCLFALTDEEFQFNRFGNAPRDPFLVVPVIDSPTEEGSLFKIGSTSVFDLAIVVKGSCGWMNSKFMSLQRLSDDQLEVLFHCKGWLFDGDCPLPEFCDCDCATRLLSPLPESVTIQEIELTKKHLYALIRAAQASSSTTMIKLPNSTDIAPLNIVARSGVRKHHLDAPAFQQLASTIHLTSVGMGKSHPDAGVFPIIPILGGTEITAPELDGSCIDLWGAAIAMKRTEKPFVRWRDRSVIWVDVCSLSNEQKSILISAAMRLENAEDADMIQHTIAPAIHFLSSSSTYDAFHDDGRSAPFIVPDSAAVHIATGSISNCDAGFGNAATVIAQSSEHHVESLLSSLLVRARTTGNLPESLLSAPHVVELLREAITIGFTDKAKQ